MKTIKAIYNSLSNKGLQSSFVELDDKYKISYDLDIQLSKKDANGRYYFMPVSLIHKKPGKKPKEYEIPNAVIGFTAQKTIVETALTGQRGKVKEFINIDDYVIEIAGSATGDEWPEAALKELGELFVINEPLELKCALTDLFMGPDDKVIIKKMDFAPMKETETLQTVKISLVTDRNIELIIG